MPRMSIAPEQFKTRPEDSRVAGWVKLPTGAWVTTVPLVWVVVGEPVLFSRHDGELSDRACEIHEARLPTPHEMDLALAARSSLLAAPVTLPRPDMLKPGEDPQAWRVAHMMGRAACERHDTEAKAELVKLGWDGTQFVGAIGKCLVAGEDALGPYPEDDMIALYGWPRSRTPGDVWQSLNDGRRHPERVPPPLRHDRKYSDYGTLQLLARDEAPLQVFDPVVVALILGQLEAA